MAAVFFMLPAIAKQAAAVASHPSAVGSLRSYAI
jgi:hypothetical protein